MGRNSNGTRARARRANMSSKQQAHIMAEIELGSQFFTHNDVVRLDKSLSKKQKAEFIDDLTFQQERSIDDMRRSKKTYGEKSVDYNYHAGIFERRRKALVYLKYKRIEN